MKILNLYAGIGGNRKLWGDEHDITAVEIDEKIAKVYADNNPGDEVIVGDAHDYLLHNSEQFDFIWSSPPCQSHSRMIKSGRNRKPRYPDLKLYEEILFLENYFEGKWIVENVKPFYKPLIDPTMLLGRHAIWSNFYIHHFNIPEFDNFIKAATVAKAEQMKKWLGIEYEGSIYYGDNHCPVQVLRNCVNPKLGLHILNESQKSDLPLFYS